MDALFFAFYIYQWPLTEIVDYATQILYANLDGQQKAHAWMEIQPYLPPDREAMDAGIAAIEKILTAYGVSE